MQILLTKVLSLPAPFSIRRATMSLFSFSIAYPRGVHFLKVDARLIDLLCNSSSNANTTYILIPHPNSRSIIDLQFIIQRKYYLHPNTTSHLHVNHRFAIHHSTQILLTS